MEPRSPLRPPGRKIDALRAYFASGWLFFLPYLAVYLYFWGTGGSVPLARSIFWTLHAFHLGALAAVLVRYRSIFLDPRTWFFVAIAAVFLIQGAYMEFPGDNWTHAHRIFIWNPAANFSDYVFFYQKYKSGFFFLHSLIGWVPIPARFAALSFCAAVMAALFSYQIWRLLNACGLRGSAALLGVVASLLFMGTPIQFHAYYALSSSVPSMIGAFAALTALLSAPPRQRPLLWVLALLLATFNHLQGTGIILLGSAAIACWSAQRRFGTAKTLAALAASALVTFGFAALAISQIPSAQSLWNTTANLRSEGWLSAFGSFRIWDLDTLGREGPSTRFLEIVTWLGLLNFAAAALLVAKRRVLGWLTLAPLAAILYPVSASLIAYAHQGDIITYHRYLLLALPLAATFDLAFLSAAASPRISSLSPIARASAAAAAGAALLLAGIPDDRHWLGKLRDLGDPLPAAGRLAFLNPIAAQIDADPRFSKRHVAVIADPATATFLAAHFGFHSETLRLAINDSKNPVFGDTSLLADAIAAFDGPGWTPCVIVPKRDPQLPLHFSPNGAMTRHWRSFAINESFQFDPLTLGWCEKNLTGDWVSFDLGTFHRCFVRFGYQAP